MPYYTYKCKDCGKLLEEVYQSILEDALTKCPYCDGKLVKQIGACNIVFKGEGWPTKDNKRGK